MISLAYNLTVLSPAEPSGTQQTPQTVETASDSQIEDDGMQPVIQERLTEPSSYTQLSKVPATYENQQFEMTAHSNIENPQFDSTTNSNYENQPNTGAVYEEIRDN